MRLPRRHCSVAFAALALAPCAAMAVLSEDSQDEALRADADYAAGLAALKARDAKAALPRLLAALKRFPEAADLHNELGFAYRSLRQLEPAFVHYKKALAINPRHRGAHEYIGEAYLMVGDVAAAERHLAELNRICTLPCDEARELAAAIAAHRSRQATR